MVHVVGALLYDFRRASDPRCHMENQRGAIVVDSPRYQRGIQMKKYSRLVLAALMTFAGVMHFARPDLYLKIMPPYLPLHLELVYLSGLFEIAIGVGLLVEKLRKTAAIGCILLLIAVFPANIYLFQHQDILPAPFWLHVLRLPFQAIFIAWAIWHMSPDTTASTE